MHVLLDDVFDCTVSEYWNRIFLVDDYQRRLHLEGLGFSSYECLLFREGADGLVRRDLQISGVPGLPMVLQKLVPGGRYVEKGTLDRAVNRWHFVIEPAGLGGRLQIEGDVEITPLGDGQCRRRGKIAVTARLVGIGQRVAKSLLALVDENEQKSIAFTRRFIVEELRAKT